MDTMDCFIGSMTIIFILLGVWHFFLGNFDMVVISMIFIGVCVSWRLSPKRKPRRITMMKRKCKVCGKEATRYHCNHETRELENLCEVHYAEFHPSLANLGVDEEDDEAYDEDEEWAFPGPDVEVEEEEEDYEEEDEGW